TGHLGLGELDFGAEQGGQLCRCVAYQFAHTGIAGCRSVHLRQRDARNARRDSVLRTIRVRHAHYSTPSVGSFRWRWARPRRNSSADPRTEAIKDVTSTAALAISAGSPPWMSPSESSAMSRLTVNPMPPITASANTSPHISPVGRVARPSRIEIQVAPKI